MSTAEMSVGQEQLVSFDDSDWPIDIKVWTAHQLLFGRFASTFLQDNNNDNNSQSPFILITFREETPEWIGSFNHKTQVERKKTPCDSSVQQVHEQEPRQLVQRS